MDQVPLHPVIGIDYTWDTTCSHGPMYFPHPGAGSEEIFCSIKLYCRQHVIKPKIAVIFPLI